MDASIVSSIEATDAIIHIILSGDLDYTSTLGTKMEILAATQARPQAPVIIDICAVEHIDSAGIALLILCHKAKVCEERLTVIVAAGSQPERVLQLGKFHLILTLTSIQTEPSADQAENAEFEVDPSITRAAA